MSSLSTRSLTKLSGSLLTAEEEVIDKTHLPLLESIALCRVLEDTVDQIAMVGGLSNTDLSIVEKSTGTLTARAEKYIHNDPLYNLSTAETFSNYLEKLKYLKLDVDRTCLEEIMAATLKEIKECYTFKCIIEFLQDIKTMNFEEWMLIGEECSNKKNISQLRQLMHKRTEDGLKKIQNLSEAIANFRDKVEDILFDNALRVRYVNNWENARIEQSFMICDNNENGYLDTINKYKNEIEKEIRINVEIEMYINENRKDMEEAIELWMNRYDTELEDRNTEIQKLKETREEQEKAYAALLIIYKEHKKQIDEWVIYREKKRIEDERIALWTEAAIQIQAWWRGEMVRHKLGPYNPRKRRKGAKAKGKPADKKKKK